ncbi:MAG: N-6 DNA methylase [Lacunisphaera sp.]
MARAKSASSTSAQSSANLGFEAKMWQSADKLRNNMDAAEYKHVVLGLIFLKYISDSFDEHHAKLKAGKGDYDGANPEDKDEYLAANVFWVPKDARWPQLQAKAKLPSIGKDVDDAMVALERDNPRLKGALNKNYGRADLDKHRLGELIDLIGSIQLADVASRSKDLLGRVFEYFLTQFASAEGKNGGQFYTPSCVVRLLVEMLAPYKGRIYDPACGSGGMFVQSEKFVESHGGKLGDISIYGQESNPTTRRLAVMNLALRGIEADFGPEAADTFRRDLHPDLRADYVLANPPFNDSDWHRKDDDVRWKYGVPPKGNANFAWVQHFIHHLAPHGMAGFVLANGSMSSNQSGEGEIRQKLIEADLVDCMVALPGQLFYSTQIPVCLWFICRDKSGGKPSPGAGRRPLPSGEGKYRGGYDFSGLVQIARELRAKSTPAGKLFWELVRDRRFLDLKFRREHQIGDYIADFYCDEKKLVVELDGDVHETAERKPKDAKRDAYLRSLGLIVVRIRNESLLNDTEAVLAEIASALNPPRPVGEGRGEGKQRRDRRGQTLFIDARKLGTLIDRVHRELTDTDLQKIVSTYHAWRGEKNVAAGADPAGPYADIPGFCKSATTAEIAAHGHVLTPGRYVGAEEVEDDGEPFEEKMPRLVAELNGQFTESTKLEAAIRANLKSLGFK